ncbi:MAG TPA: hypothetical protein VKY89_15205 [Thermoanaerobaculia bacterium]|nr:hypothetical protein [Thermoanaerobaculia bacterium]
MLCLVLAIAGTPAVADSQTAGALVRSLREAEGAVKKAAEASAQIARRRGDPRYAEAWKEEAGEGIEATAVLAITTACGRIERGKNLGQVRDLEEAFRLATGARQDLEALAGRLDQLRARQAVRDLLIRNEIHRVELRRAQENAAPKAATEKTALKAATEKAAEKAATEKAAERLAAEQASADKPRREQEAARVEAASRDHAPAQRLAREIPRRAAESRPPSPPFELRAAARALFRADYEEVVRTLAGVTFAERRAAVTASLLLAAARYSLYLQGGEKDPHLRRQAGENARTCRRLAPFLSPDPKLFSPRFVQFFHSPA